MNENHDKKIGPAKTATGLNDNDIIDFMIYVDTILEDVRQHNVDMRGGYLQLMKKFHSDN